MRGSKVIVPELHSFAVAPPERARHLLALRFPAQTGPSSGEQMEGNLMHSSLIGQVGKCWIVEAPDGEEHVLSSVNIVTGGVPAFVGMEGVMVLRSGNCRRFYARWTSGSPASPATTFGTASAAL